MFMKIQHKIKNYEGLLRRCFQVLAWHDTLKNVVDDMY